MQPILKHSSSGRYSLGSLRSESEFSEESLGSYKGHLSSSKKRYPVELLINFLTEFVNDMDVDAMKRFEQLVIHTISTARDTEVNKIMRNHGWEGDHFVDSPENPFDAKLVLQALSNLYLKLKNQQHNTSFSDLFGMPDTHALDQLLSFCPDILINHLRHEVDSGNSKLQTQVRSITFMGACMLVDISGFSKFSGAMCSKGVTGLDELRRATNGFLGHFVQIVYEYNGDVIAFAGDALICLFRHQEPVDAVSNGLLAVPSSASEKDPSKSSIKIPGFSVKLGRSSSSSKSSNGVAATASGQSSASKETVHALTRNCCYRALQCATRLRTHKTKTLATHIGVSYGEMKMAMLGGHNDQWTYVMNGECVSQLSSCIDDAQAQQVVVTPACYRQAKLSIEGSKDMIVMQKCKPSGNIRVNYIGSRLHHQKSRSGTIPGENVTTTTSSLGLFGGTSQQLTHTTSESIYQSEHDPSWIAGENSPGLRALNLDKQEFASTSFGVSLSRSASGDATGPAIGMDGASDSRRTRTPGMLLKSHSSRTLFTYTENDKNFYGSVALFVPAPVLNAVYSDSLDQIGELRDVTTMFLSLDSYSPKEHSDPTTLQPFFFMAQKVLHDTGGFLRQFIVDDKGCVFIAMWGMPSFTYTNKASRAVCCAAKIRTNCTDLSHRCSVGISTGTVFCGTVGALERRDFAGIGTDVNMAARFMSKAKGSILVDEETYGGLRSDIQKLLTRVSEPMQLKGMSAAVSPYRYSSDILPMFSSVVGGAGNDNDTVGATIDGTIRPGYSPTLRIRKSQSDYDNRTRNKSGKGSGTYNQILKRKVMSVVEPQLDIVSNKFTISPKALTRMNSIGFRKSFRYTSRIETENSNQVHFTIITGTPAGTGKAGAVDAFRFNARKRHIPCYKVTSYPGLRDVPYGLIKELLLELVGLTTLEMAHLEESLADDLIARTYVDDECATLEERLQAKQSLMLVLGIDPDPDQPTKQPPHYTRGRSPSPALPLGSISALATGTTGSLSGSRPGTSRQRSRRIKREISPRTFVSTDSHTDDFSRDRFLQLSARSPRIDLIDGVGHSSSHSDSGVPSNPISCVTSSSGSSKNESSSGGKISLAEEETLSVTTTSALRDQAKKQLSAKSRSVEFASFHELEQSEPVISAVPTEDSAMDGTQSLMSVSCDAAAAAFADTDALEAPLPEVVVAVEGLHAITNATMAADASDTDYSMPVTARSEVEEDGAISTHRPQFSRPALLVDVSQSQRSDDLSSTRSTFLSGSTPDSVVSIPFSGSNPMLRPLPPLPPVPPVQLPRTPSQHSIAEQANCETSPSFDDVIDRQAAAALGVAGASPDTAASSTAATGAVHERLNKKRSLLMMQPIDSYAPGVAAGSGSGTRIPRRSAGDRTICKVIHMLLNNAPAAVIIEHAHYCDELSWNELLLLLNGAAAVQMVVLLTMKATVNGVSIEDEASINTSCPSIQLQSSSGAQTPPPRHVAGAIVPTAVSSTPHGASAADSQSDRFGAEIGSSTDVINASPLPLPSMSRSKSVEKSQFSDKSDQSDNTSTSTVFTNLARPMHISIDIDFDAQADYDLGHLGASIDRASTRSSGLGSGRSTQNRPHFVSPYAAKHFRKTSGGVVDSRYGSTSSMRSLASSPRGRPPDALVAIIRHSNTSIIKSSLLSPDELRALLIEAIPPQALYLQLHNSSSNSEKDRSSAAADNLPHPHGGDVPAAAGDPVTGGALVADDSNRSSGPGIIEKDAVLNDLNLESASAVTDELVQFIYNISSGNVFWCHALVDFIKESGLSKFNQAFNFDTAAVLSSHGEQTSKGKNSNNRGNNNHGHALRTLILLRLEKLSLDQQLVLKYASVVGHEFTQDMLRAIIPVQARTPRRRSSSTTTANGAGSAGPLDEAELMEALCDAGFIYCIRPYPVAMYAFLKPVIQTTLYELLPPSDSAHIHGMLAKYIESAFAADLKPFYASLGYHYRSSNAHRAQAFKYELKAGDQALSRGAFVDAAFFMTSACDLASSNLEWEVLREVLQMAVSDLQQMEEVYTEKAQSLQEAARRASAAAAAAAAVAAAAISTPRDHSERPHSPRSPRSPRISLRILASALTPGKHKQRNSKNLDSDTDSPRSTVSSIEAAEAERLHREAAVAEAARTDTELKLKTYNILLERADRALKDVRGLALKELKQSSQASYNIHTASNSNDETDVSTNGGSRKDQKDDTAYRAGNGIAELTTADSTSATEPYMGSATEGSNSILANHRVTAAPRNPAKKNPAVAGRPLSLDWQPSYAFARKSTEDASFALGSKSVDKYTSDHLKHLDAAGEPDSKNESDSDCSALDENSVVDRIQERNLMDSLIGAGCCCRIT